MTYCPPCERHRCPARKLPGAQQLPTHRQMERWNRQAYERQHREALRRRQAEQPSDEDDETHVLDYRPAVPPPSRLTERAVYGAVGVLAAILLLFLLT